MFPISSRQAKQRRGFTLIELLVVVAIIAMLMAILMPALGKARKQAKLIACAANLRSYGFLLRMYATENQEVLPLGYLWYSYYAATAHPGGWQDVPFPGRVFALAYNGNSSGKAYYCPLQTDNRWMFNTTQNPWAFGGKYPDSKFNCDLNRSSTTNIGYTVRPMLLTWIDDTTKVMKANTPNISRDQLMPKTFNLAPGTAIASDVIGSTLLGNGYQYAQGHIEENMNVFYADNSVQTIPYSVYAVNYTKSGGPSILSWSGSANTGMYVDFDRAH